MSFLPIRSVVIEEHPFKRLIAARAFEDLGCEVVMSVAESATVLEALKVNGPIDVALCSLSAQCTQSLAAIEQLCSSGLVTSVIICSDHSADLHSAIQRMLTMHKVKVLGYVNSPVRSSTISPMLEQLLEKSGRSRTDDQRPSGGKLFDEKELKHAVYAKEFKAFFQPKFNLITGVVDSFEVLVRWEHPRIGMLSPADFLPFLHSFNLMDELLFTLMEQGLAFLLKVPLIEGKLGLAFNVQAEQFSNPDLVTRITELLDKYEVSASRLTFEITESGLLESSPTVLKSLIHLRMMGAGLSIDDFGTGFSSLERLCQLPFTEIKLDAGFIRDLETSISNSAVVSSTLALGNTLNMSVVVEGVETECQRRLLIKLGCTHAQGYLCARPMNSKQSLLWLDSKGLGVNNV